MKTSVDVLLHRLTELATDADESGCHQLATALMLIYRGSTWPRATRMAVVNTCYMLATIVESLLPKETSTPTGV